MPSVLDILRPSVVTGMMNEVRTPFDRWQEFFGMQPKGAACVPSEVRTVNVDLVNDDRTVSQFTAPGADAAKVAPLVIGTRQVTAPRTFERMDLNYEILNNIRAIGKGASELDRGGLAYLKQQMAHLLRRTRRFREFLIWGALRGSCQFKITANDWIPVISGGDVTIDWQMPANNKNQLNGIIGTSWDNVAAEIITDLAEVSARSEEDTGLPITHAWCNSSRWVKILNNTQVRNMGGTANTAFEQWAIQIAQMKGTDGSGVDSSKIEATGVLKGWPSITWHITDRVLKLDGTSTKYLGDDDVIFHPDPDPSWFFGYEVKESTNQAYGQSPVDVYGFASWLKHPVDTDTPKYLLYNLDNFLPVKNAKAGYFADVTP